MAMAVVVVRARAVARMRSECSDGGESGGVVVEWLWIGGSKGKGVGSRVVVEWRWICGGKGEAALRQQLCGSAAAAASLAEAVAAFLQRGVGCGGGSGQLGGGMIISKTRNNLWV